MDSLFEWDVDDEKKVPDPRSGHVCCYLGDSLFVWGGYNDISEEDGHQNTVYRSYYMDPTVVWFYYPTAAKWRRVRTTHFSPNISSGAGAVYVPRKSSVYLFFGFSTLEPKTSVYSFNVPRLQWRRIKVGPEEIGRNPAPRDKFALWEYHNKIYIFGGYGPPLEGYLCSQGIFDEDVTPFPEVRHISLHTIIRMLDQKMPGLRHDSLISGWQQTVIHSKVILLNVTFVQLSIVRGWNNQLLEFDVDQETWREVTSSGDIPPTRAAHTATRVKGNVFIFGGRHMNQRLNDLYQLDLSNMIWTSISYCDPAPCGRSWHSMGCLSSNNQLIVVGGYSDKSEVLGDVWTYNIKLRKWSEHSRPSSRTKRLWHTMAVTDSDDLIAFGGCVNDIYNQTPSHTNDLATLRLSPDSLYRLAMKMIVQNENIFEYQLDHILEESRNSILDTWSVKHLLHIEVELHESAYNGE